MSLNLAAESGFGNTWIFVLILVSNLIFQALVSNFREKGVKASFDYLEKKERRLLFILQAIISISFVYGFFLPLTTDTNWLYVGLLIYSGGLIFSGKAILDFFTSPKEKPVTKGVYRFSRNPMYVGTVLMYMGIGIACVSWLYLLLTTALMVLSHTLVTAEEHWCLEKYGSFYQEYMTEAPRWIGIPKRRRPFWRLDLRPD